MAAELEMAVVRAALVDAVRLPSDTWLNINLSPSVLIGVHDLTELIAESQLKVYIELTEHEAIENYAAIRDAVHAMGPKVRIVIDDAGSGYASMRHVVELRPAFVKLDRTIVANIDRDEARRGLAAGMRHFARTAGFWLIAEGVETEGELAALKELDIHFAQGFLLGRPVPIDQVLAAPSEGTHTPPASRSPTVTVER